ncbi:MAG: HyaD/HybD family hydrogenase maturation endopeptidase [Candidatus Poribacteria bacterium]
MNKNTKIAVVGVGNLLLKDEGVGVHIVHALQKSGKLPDHVQLIDAGTATFDILHLIEDVDKLIVIDAVEGGGEPGTVYRFSPDDVEFGNLSAISLHELDLSNTLAMAELLGNKPKSVVIIGIEPKEITLCLELSPQIEAKIEKIIELTLKEIGSGIRN